MATDAAEKPTHSYNDVPPADDLPPGTTAARAREIALESWSAWRRCLWGADGHRADVTRRRWVALDKAAQLLLAREEGYAAPRVIDYDLP